MARKRNWIAYGFVALAGGLVGTALGARATLGFLADAKGQSRTELFVEAQTQQAMRGMLDGDGGREPSERTERTGDRRSPFDVGSFDLAAELDNQIKEPFESFAAEFDSAFGDAIDECSDEGAGVDIDIEDREGNGEGER